MKLDKIYEDLLNLPGVAGNEKYIREYMKKELKKYTDEIVQDKLGSIFGVKRSKNPDAPVLMLAGHMDEVGAMVVGITKNGFIKMQNLGGVSGEVFLSQHLNIYIEKDDFIPGVTASIPPHLIKNSKAKKLEFSDLLLDIGACSKEEAIKMGVKLGQMIVPSNKIVYTKDGKKVISKAFDNRWGCAMALETFSHFQNIDLDVTIVCGATVQEEVGLRGAQTATQMINPDVFIAFDNSPANDIKKDDNAWGELGKGFLLRFYDPGTVMHKGLREYFIELAEKNKFKYQYYISMGGTDAARAQLVNEGIIATALNLPARYIHSTTSMINLEDHLEAKKMIFKFIEELNKESLEKIINNV